MQVIQEIQGETIVVEHSYTINKQTMFNNCTFLIKPPAVIRINHENRYAMPNVIFAGCKFRLIENPNWRANEFDYYSPIRIAAPHVLFNRCKFENMQLSPKGSVILSTTVRLLREFRIKLKLDFEACSFNNISTGSLIATTGSIEFNLQGITIDNSTIFQGLIEPRNYIRLKLSGENIIIRNSQLLTSNTDWLVTHELRIIAELLSQIKSAKIERSYINQLFLYPINTSFFNQLYVSDSYVSEIELPKEGGSSVTISNSSINKLLTEQSILQIKPSDSISQDYTVRFHNCYITKQEEFANGITRRWSL